MIAAIASFFAAHSRLPWILGVGIIATALGGMALDCKILTLERDAAISGRVVAEQSLHHQQRVDAAQMRALTKAREEDHDREKFIEDTERRIVQADDGPLAPVLRVTLERVHARYAGRAAAAAAQR